MFGPLEEPRARKTRPFRDRQDRLLASSVLRQVPAVICPRCTLLLCLAHSIVQKQSIARPGVCHSKLDRRYYVGVVCRMRVCADMFVRIPLLPQLTELAPPGWINFNPWSNCET